MDSKIKRKIGRGVKEANRRKRLSTAMKASWARRRTAVEFPSTAAEYDKMAGRPLDAAVESEVYRTALKNLGTKTHVITDDDIFEVAKSLLGRENVRIMLTNAISNALK